MEFFQKSDQVENNLDQIFYPASRSECGSTSFGSGKPAQFPLHFVLWASNKSLEFQCWVLYTTSAHGWWFVNTWNSRKVMHRGRSRCLQPVCPGFLVDSSCLWVTLGAAARQRSQSCLMVTAGGARLWLHSSPTCSGFSWGCWNCTQLNQIFGLLEILLVCSFILISLSISSTALYYWWM